MRREGYIIEEIIEYSNMSEAFDSVLRGTDRKRSRQGRFLLAHREKIITELTASIADGSFRLGGYHEREIEEYGKKRILQILSMKDRIAVFAIMNVVDRGCKGTSHPCRNGRHHTPGFRPVLGRILSS